MSITKLQIPAQGSRARPIPAIEGHNQWHLAWRRLSRDKVATASAALIVIMTGLALAAPAFAALTGHGPAQQFPNAGLSATGAPAGPGVTGTILGVSAGLVAGYYGGWIDTVLSRLVDAVLAFPYIVLALALAAVFGHSLPVVIGVISFFAWSGIARVVRGQTILLKERDYIEAARSVGAGPWRIMFSEILPNLAGLVLVLATLSIPNAIIFEATLSFLGLGIQPPAASWGNILADAQNNYGVAWWYLLFPALALLITTLAFNLLGDGIRDALDPGGEYPSASWQHRRRQRRRRRIPRTPTASPQATVRQPDTYKTAPGPERHGAPGPSTASKHEPWPARLAGHLHSWLMLLAFLTRRTIAGAMVLWVVSTATFGLFFTRPAILVARSMAGKEPTAAELRQITRQLGLNQPIIVQYGHFLDRLLHANLGYSYTTGEPVTTILSQDLPRTASVVVGGVVLWLAVGISVGVLSATRARSLFDRAATAAVLTGLSMPTFVLGQLLLLGVFVPLNKHGITWVQDGYAGPTQGLAAWAGHMILPWITLATVSAAVYSRLSRASLLETLTEDYIRTARAKGLSERRIILRHALRSALTPVVSQLGIDVGTLLGGVVVVENVFGIGGAGQDSVQAIDQGNLPLIIGFVLVTTLFVVVANIVVDFCYTLIDPRVRRT